MINCRLLKPGKTNSILIVIGRNDGNMFSHVLWIWLFILHYRLRQFPALMGNYEVIRTYKLEDGHKGYMRHQVLREN
jgi:hypothetical protein